MKTKFLFYLAIFLVGILASCSKDSQESQAEGTVDGMENAYIDTGIYTPGLSYVYFDESMVQLIEEDLEKGQIMTKSSQLNEMVQLLGVKSLKRLFPHAGEYEVRTRREGLHRWYVVEYSSDIPHTKASEDFMTVPGVDFIEPVPQIKINDFNDLNSKLWGLDNVSYPGIDINVKPVWRNFTTGNENVIVSVVDEGIDLNHEDLATNCLENSHYNAVDNNNVIVSGEHGTHVAGTIAAVSNNGKGIAGIAGGDYENGKSGVKLMSCQIIKTDSKGNTTTGSSPAAIKWGADHGAVISQNSWGYNFDLDKDGKYNSEEREAALKAKITEADRQAVDYFIKYAGCDNDGNQLPDSPMKGGVVIFAAGNDAFENGAPANYDKVISVGAISSDGTRASFSNYGDWVDIAAPGTQIYSTCPSNSYASFDGTSMACPHVSGVAALLVSYYGGPGFTNDILREKLIGGSNTQKFSPSHQIGGLLDAYGAFSYGETIEVDPVSELNADSKSNNITFTWTVPADSRGKAAYAMMFIYGKDKAVVEAATPNSYNGLKTVSHIHQKGVNEQEIFTISGLEFNTEYYIKAYAYSYSFNFSPEAKLVTVTTKENLAPVVHFEYDKTFSMKSSDKIIVNFSIEDPDGHAFEMSYVNGSPADSLLKTPTGDYNITFVGAAAPEGTYVAKIISKDEYGAESITDITYTILGNRPPQKINEIENIILTSKGQEFTIDMKKYVTDPDGELLKHEIMISDPKILHMSSKTDKVIGTSLGYGLTHVTITSKDAKGKSVTFTFKVLIKDPSDPLSLYPNPVIDYLQVGLLEEVKASIKIISSTGKTIYDQTTDVSAFEPASIDMTACSPGQYKVIVEFGGNVFDRSIVKL